VSNFAARQPLKASLLAMAAGAMLTLALQRGLAQGKARI
jgi:formate/nitrite transporter FocA (FNT family)